MEEENAVSAASTSKPETSSQEAATDTGSPKSPITSAEIEESEELKMEKEAAAAEIEESSTSVSVATETNKLLKDVTASGAVKEDKPLKHGGASKKPTDPLDFIRRMCFWFFNHSLNFILILGIVHSLNFILFLGIVHLFIALDYNMLSQVGLMFTIHLNAHFHAGSLGYNLAQHRLVLQTKYKIPMPDNEETERPRVLHIAARLIEPLLNVGIAFSHAWVSSHSPYYTPVDLMMHFLLPLLGVLLLWITYIAVALGNAFMGEEGLTLVIFYFFFIMMNYILILVTLGHTVATIVTWFAVLGLSGFLGFSIRVYNDTMRMTFKDD